MDANFRTLDLNLLRVFDEVMAERSLTRAARNLSITQPAVSNALRRLREALGDELMRRAGAGVEPTPRAAALWPVVRDALRQLEHSLVPAAFEPAVADNVFTLAMADATAAELLPGTARRLGRDAPGVSLRVVPLTTRDPRRLLAEEDVDLALGYFPAVMADLTARAQAGEAVAFEAHRLYTGRYVCVMRRGHPLAGSPLTLDAYCTARHLLVSFSGRPWGFVDEALGAIGRERRIVMTANQFFTAGRVVATSDLLTVLPRHFVGTPGMGMDLITCELPLTLSEVHVDALWHRRLHGAPAHAWLRRLLVRVAGDAFARSLDPAAQGQAV
ncbi:MAG: LysR family transcriptional regulator [Xenophilus sp.]